MSLKYIHIPSVIQMGVKTVHQDNVTSCSSFMGIRMEVVRRERSWRDSSKGEIPSHSAISFRDSTCNIPKCCWLQTVRDEIILGSVSR